MRHGKKFNHLTRKAGHRAALLKNLSIALITYKRIVTTLAKGKALRTYIEPLLTKTKTNSTHSRRVVFSYLQNKEALKELFGPVAEKIANRPGGYTRVIRNGFRLGDNAEMCVIELVDFNEFAAAAEVATEKKGRRRKSTAAPAAAVAKPATEATTTTSNKDNLKKIEGIGPKIEELLNAANILTFEALANTEASAIKTILDNAGSNFKTHDPTTWPKQADMAAKGLWDELKAWQDVLDGGKEVK
jgi:large subunit ribosomal protein L17